MTTTIKRFFNDAYMVEPDNDSCEVIAFRAGQPVEGDILRILNVSEADRRFMFLRLNNYTYCPLLVKAGTSPLFVLSSLYPASGICLAVKANVSLRSALALAQNGSLGQILISPSFEKVEMSKRISDDEREELVNIASVFSRLNGSSDLMRECGSYRAATVSSERAALAAEFVGCELTFDKNYPCEKISGYDITLFTSFMLCALMFIRRASVERRGTLEFSMLSNGGLAACVTAICPKDTSTGEFNALRRYADRMNIYMSIIENRGTFRIEICPHRTDLSIIKLKDQWNSKL